MKKVSFLLLVILGLAVFLRLNGMPGNYLFSGELGKELLYMRQFSLSHTIPLTGMSTSHEWLSYGPIYYWIMIPVFTLFGGNPFILFYSALAVSFIGLILNWRVIEKIAGARIALLTTAIQALSPLLIWQTQLSKLHVFFFILIPIFMYLTFLLWKKETRWVFWAGIVFGLMFSFHFSQIPLLGVVFLLFIIKKYRFIEWLKFAAGVLIPNLTLLWNDRNLIIWVPYRIITFGGRNIAETFQSFNEFLGRSVFWDQKIWIFGSLIFLISFIHFAWTRRNIIRKDFLTFYLTSTIVLMFLANFLHNTPPIHYFLPVFTVLPILFSVYLEKLKYWWVLLAIIFLINFKGYFSFKKPDDYISYNQQIKTVDAIIADTKGKPFAINRIGPYDYFPENYSQNYKYLVISRGGKLIDSSKTVYTMNDYTNSYTKEK